MADNNVGSCKVFHVYTTLATDGNHPYDSVALEIDGEMFYVNNLSTSGNQKDNSVTITEPGKVNGKRCVTITEPGKVNGKRCVAITEPGKVNGKGEITNCGTFSSVSADFLSWALAKKLRASSLQFFFERNSKVCVDCGSVEIVFSTRVYLC
jgi:hypothetical protein